MTNTSSIARLYSLLLMLCLSLLLLFINYHVYAADETPSIGTIVWVHGSVKAISATGSARDLKRRSPIYEKDTIQTDATSTGEIVFTDSSVVSLRSATTFQIDQYQFNSASPKNGKYVASIVKGGFRTITGLISHGNPDNYQVNTPVATIGVRGTDYSVFYSLTTGLAVKLSKGIIKVENSLGQVELNAAKNRLYAAITDLKHPPVQTASPSPAFNNQPGITSAPAAGTTSSSGPVQNSTIPTGTTKTVSGFCIGN